MDSSAAAEQLVTQIASYGSCAVAFSGGVDSAVVLKAATLALGDKAVGVIGIGPALAEVELADARNVAQMIDANLVETPTAEINRPGYIANGSDRCFHCKTELYTEVLEVARQRRLAVIANGANQDDRGDYRPGQLAADEFAVRSPLVECGFDKAMVRTLAEHWGLPIASKPASPCLASRLAYGVEVTPERLHRVEAAEQFVRGLGLQEFRVRYHDGDLARIEVPIEELPRLCEAETRRRLTEVLIGLGFRYVTLDLGGFQSGSMNRVLSGETMPPEVMPVESLVNWTSTARSDDSQTPN